MAASYRIESLGPLHDRSGFDTGSAPLDDYLRQRAMQDIRRRASHCFVAVDLGSVDIAGYYTLAAGGVALGDLPAAMAKRLPRYPSVPIARLGRLAVASPHRGRKLGAALLFDAVHRAANSEVMMLALMVDAKDDQAVAFYQHHGFTAVGNPRQLMLPLSRFAA